MIRLLLFLFGKRGFEDCKSCETLKLQLEIANAEKKQLTETLIGILKPTVHEATSQEIKPLQQSAILFSRRKHELEEQARQRAAVIHKNPIMATPESNIDKAFSETINRLESELGVVEEVKEKVNE